MLISINLDRFVHTTSNSFTWVLRMCSSKERHWSKDTPRSLRIETKTLRTSKRRTLHWLVCFLAIASFSTGGPKFLISRKVWYSLEMRKLMYLPLHHIIWFRNPLSWLLPGDNLFFGSIDVILLDIPKRLLNFATVAHFEVFDGGFEIIKNGKN